MFFDFQTKSPVSNFVVCLLGPKHHDLGKHIPRKPENTVYLSTFTNLLWYLTVMRIPLLCVQNVFCYLSDSSTQKYYLMEMLKEKNYDFVVFQSEATDNNSHD